jgi:hypothetical protein
MVQFYSERYKTNRQTLTAIATPPPSTLLSLGTQLARGGRNGSDWLRKGAK